MQLPRRGAVRALAALAVLTGALLPFGRPGAASAAERPATVYVLQGVAGVTASVLVDGRTVADAAAARTVVGPLELAAGRHTVSLQDGGTEVASSTFTVTAGASVDVVAHRFPDVKRTPSFTLYPNDLSPVPAGRTRLLLAHAAVVPPADILVDGSVLVRNIANGESATKTVPAGAYRVAIVPTATDGPAVLGPTTLTVKAGTLTNVIAIGDPVAGTMDAIVHQLRVPVTGAGSPSAVNTGDGGQAAGLFAENAGDRESAVLPLLLLAAGAGVLLLRRARTSRGTG